MSRNSHIEKEVRAALAATGLPYEITNGSRHRKVYLAGKFIAALCHNPGRGRDSKQAIRAIRQRVKELECRTAEALVKT